MSDIAKSILGGGWSLVAGWMLPAARNVFLFGILVLPSLRTIPLAAELSSASLFKAVLASTWYGRKPRFRGIDARSATSASKSRASISSIA
jgi:hypothetical protein